VGALELSGTSLDWDTRCCFDPFKLGACGFTLRTLSCRLDRLAAWLKEETQTFLISVWGRLSFTFLDWLSNFNFNFGLLVSLAHFPFKLVTAQLFKDLTSFNL
jgi:hypothetical protein